jgi:hypothetical protein
MSPPPTETYIKLQAARSADLSLSSKTYDWFGGSQEKPHKMYTASLKFQCS